MAQSPIERAARALCIAENRDPDELFGTSGREYPFWHLRRDAVRAVFAAIREPSDRMVEAAYLAAADGDIVSASDAWRPMIDAALAGEG
jgi:hypothetical protein